MYIGLVTNRGLLEQVPSHFASFPSGRRNTISLTWLNHFRVHSRLFSLAIVVTLVHTFPRRTRQPSLALESSETPARLGSLGVSDAHRLMRRDSKVRLGGPPPLVNGRRRRTSPNGKTQVPTGLHGLINY